MTERLSQRARVVLGVFHVPANEREAAFVQSAYSDKAIRRTIVELQTAGYLTPGDRVELTEDGAVALCVADSVAFCEERTPSVRLTSAPIVHKEDLDGD